MLGFYYQGKAKACSFGKLIKTHNVLCTICIFAVKSVGTAYRIDYLE